MTWLRSLAFNIAFVAATVTIGFVGLPLVPAAVNSGLYWGRRSFLKRRGRAVTNFLPPIPPGLPRREAVAEAERRIEAATAALEREGTAG